jgi:ferredoxin
MADPVNIYIMGSRYQVPPSLTIMQALEYAGYRLVRGVGCRRGFCGACATVYRIQGDYRLNFALACQTMVEEGMCLSMIPFFPATETTYDIENLQPTAKQILEIYPDAITCMGCNTCTKSCPQEIDVLTCMSNAIRGNITDVAKMSFDCILCGLCSIRCPAELTPYNVALLSRRLYGRHIAPRAEHLRVRVDDIQAGVFDEELAQLKRASVDDLQAKYEEREIEL